VEEEPQMVHSRLDEENTVSIPELLSLGSSIGNIYSLSIGRKQGMVSNLLSLTVGVLVTLLLN
jgi:hypothetical protein